MIFIFLADGFEETEAVTPIDMLRRCQKEVITVGVTGKTAVSSHNIPVVCDITIDEMPAEEPEMIILPGGKAGVDNLIKSEKLAQIIRGCDEKGIFIGAICAAPSIIGSMGLLKGRRAVCYPGFESFLEGAQVLDVPAVRDGHFITARGAGASLEFSYELVKALLGEDAAEKLAGTIVWQR